MVKERKEARGQFQLIKDNIFIPPALFVMDHLARAGSKLTVKGTENLELIREHSNPVIFCCNHIGQDDLFIMVEAFNQAMHHLGGKEGQWGVPYSRFHEENDSGYRLWVNLFRSVGFRMSPVTQPYRNRIVVQDGSSPSEPADPPASGNLSFVLKPYSRTAIFPESSRSYGALFPAETALGFLIQLAKKSNINLQIVPMSIVPADLRNHSREITLLNSLKGKPSAYTITFGYPIQYEKLAASANRLAERFSIGSSDDRKINQELLTHVIMMAIRDLLPPEMHGVYAEDFPHLRDVLIGDIKLAMLPNVDPKTPPVIARSSSSDSMIWEPLDILPEKLVRPTYRSVGVLGIGAVGRFFLNEIRQDERVKLSSGKSRLTNDIDEVISQKPELIIFSVPHPVVKESLGNLLDKVSYPATILLPQNGVDVVDNELINECNAKGITLVRASLFTMVKEGDGKVHYNQAKKRIALTSMNPANVVEAQRAERFFRSLGFQTALVENYHDMEWTKLFANCFGRSGLITRLSPIETFRDPDLFAIELTGMREKILLMEQAGIHLVDFPWIKIPFTKLAHVIKRFPSYPPMVVRDVVARLIAGERENLPPTHRRQLESGRIPVEIDTYHQPFIDLAKRIGTTLPFFDIAIMGLKDSLIQEIFEILAIPDINERESSLAQMNQRRKRELIDTYKNFL